MLHVPRLDQFAFVVRCGALVVPVYNMSLIPFALSL